MKTKRTRNIRKILALAMLLSAAVTSKAQWTSGNPTVLTSGYTVQGGSTGGALGITTLYGTLTLGPENGNPFCDIVTNEPYFYFNSPLCVNGGGVSSYNTYNLYLQTGNTGSGGTNRVTILNSNGNVGVGTTSPTERLDVSGADANGTISYFRNGTNYWNQIGANFLSQAFNQLTQAGDNGIIWTNTNSSSTSNGFVIAPWKGNNFGLRIDGTTDNVTLAQNVTIGPASGSALGWPISYFGINASRNSSATWTIPTDGYNNAGQVMFGDWGGNLRFATIPNSSTPGVSQTSISDAQILSDVAMTITQTGQVVIGSPSLNITTPGSYKLYVAGGILTEQVKVALHTDNVNWSDYVFANDYKLKSLNEVEQYITANKHLPEVPSSDDVKKDGIDVAQMDATLLKKIEELTLYVIQLQKENNSNVEQIQQLQSQIKLLSDKK